MPRRLQQLRNEITDALAQSVNTAKIAIVVSYEQIRADEMAIDLLRFQPASWDVTGGKLDGATLVSGFALTDEVLVPLLGSPTKLEWRFCCDPHCAIPGTHLMLKTTYANRPICLDFCAAPIPLGKIPYDEIVFK